MEFPEQGSAWSAYAVANMHDEDDRALTELRERWPDFDIYRPWWGWYAIPKGPELVSALFADSLDAQLRGATQT